MAPSPAYTSRERSSKPGLQCRSQPSHQRSIQSDPRGRDLYGRITDQIIAAIQAGASPWRMPWHHNGTATSRPTNAITGRKYRGINTVVLCAAAESAGFEHGSWATYAQWQAAGAQVRKGERATTVVLWKERAAADEDAPDEDSPNHRRFIARAFSVFNCAQVSGFEPRSATELPESERLAKAEAFIAQLGIRTICGASQACYQPATDTVVLPPFAQFRDAASFYATWLHECGHASGAPHRLNRDLSGRFGSAAYALEEITVELLSGFVLADLSLAHQPRPDHAAYIASWLKVLKEDPRAIFVAASLAQQAADWMHAQQPEQLGSVSRDTSSLGE